MFLSSWAFVARRGQTCEPYHTVDSHGLTRIKICNKASGTYRQDNRQCLSNKCYIARFIKQLCLKNVWITLIMT
jgi:hypothetical protein